MQTRRHLTGITTTGTPHLGNYVGAIRPAIAASRRDDVESFYFLADYHALVKCDDPARVQRSTLEIAASWLALGLDPARVLFYRQSDIPEIPELTWLLTCVTAKGLLNRAHAYKAAVDANAGGDADAGISAGLYLYPVLMAADILLFNAHEVPVGRDQVQHIEMARDIAQRFNHIYGHDYFVLPEARIDAHVATLPGTDGRKMSKSYNNAIDLWLPPSALKKAILGIVTDSREPGEPKDPDHSNLFAIYQAFADADEAERMRRAFADGIAWGDAKQAVFERLDAELAEPRERYDALISKPDEIEDVLRAGAANARTRARPLMDTLREAVGLRGLSGTSSERRHSRSANAVLPATKSPRFISYRETDGLFHFKLVDGDGDVLLQSRGFDSPKKGAQHIARLIEQGIATATDGVDASGQPVLHDERGADIATVAANIDRIRQALAVLKLQRES
ncbi:MAG: tryptophan--tRNA ligase [Rhodanobacteraceae bacterium]